jgi:hypothetical protein
MFNRNPQLRNNLFLQPHTQQPPKPSLHWSVSPIRGRQWPTVQNIRQSLMQFRKASRTWGSTMRKLTTQIYTSSVWVSTCFFFLLQCISNVITVLDPNYKLAYVESRWSTAKVMSGRVGLQALVSFTSLNILSADCCVV